MEGSTGIESARTNKQQIPSSETGADARSGQPDRWRSMNRDDLIRLIQAEVVDVKWLDPPMPGAIIVVTIDKES